MGRNGHNPRLCALRRGGSNPGAESLEAADVRWMARRCLGPKSARRRLSIFAVVGAADTRRIAVLLPGSVGTADVRRIGVHVVVIPARDLVGAVATVRRVAADPT